METETSNSQKQNANTTAELDKSGIIEQKYKLMLIEELYQVPRYRGQIIFIEVLIMHNVNKLANV